MTTIDPHKPVMVTGATGYVAGRLVQALLEKGHTVHAAVRDPDDRGKLKALEALAEALPGSIRYFEADLLVPGSYREAMAGCELVFHTASPFTTHVADPQKELIDPALLGTRNVLEEVNRTPSVKRVVLTSSCAAIYGDNADLEKTPDGVFTEEVWNTSSSLEHQPYSYSKTLAEREAWRIVEAQSRWDLVVINPSLVIGPGIKPHPTSESYKLIKQLGDGTMKSGVPSIGMGVVDVREVAQAHVAAGFRSEAKGRHIVSGHNTDISALARALVDRYGAAYPIPRRVMPKWLVWLAGPLVNKALSRKFVSRNVGLPWKADNGKSIRELGVTYRPLEESMNDFFQQLVDAGAFAKA